jgi:basic membrane protein A
VFAALFVVVLALALASCSDDSGGGNGSGSGDSGDKGGGEKIKVAWLFFGPKNDGGYNVSQWKTAQAAIDKTFGDQVEQVETDNIPYTEQLSQITEQYITSGANLIIDTVAGGELFTDVCGENPEVHCVEINPFSKEARDALPENVSSVFFDFWNPAYLIGMGAGGLTKSNTVGFISAYNIPSHMASSNAYALGCQRVNPDCKVRRVNLNNYYDPSKSVEVTKSLVNTGADVIFGWPDDPSYCETADQLGVRAFGHYVDYRELCPDAWAGANVWDWGGTHHPNEVKLEVEGKWTGGRYDEPKLGEGSNVVWADDLPQELKDEIQKVYDDIRSGTNVFTGPIYDKKGKLRVKEGEELESDFMYKWDWAVRGAN